MRTIPNVISRHAEEASFLWVLRAAAVGQPHYALDDLARLDDRIEAHLDGLRIAGDDGWAECAGALAAGEPGELFAAGVLALESGDAARVGHVEAAAAEAPEAAGGLVSALGWLAFDRVAPLVRRLIAAADPVRRRVGIAAAAVHRQNPGAALADAAASDDPPLRARALRAAGELGRGDLAPVLRRSLESDDAACRFWAARSTLLVAGETAPALAALGSIAESGSAYAEQAAALFARRADPAAVRKWYRAAAGTPKDARNALAAAAALGEADAVPWAIDLMKYEPLARAAGEAFAAITGVDLAEQDLDTRPPADAAAQPTEEASDDDVAMDADTHLPWPEPARVKGWWDRNAGSFTPDTRYLLGRPVERDWLRQVLREGKQRQRAAAALELAMREPGEPLFEVRAPAARQRELLGA